MKPILVIEQEVRLEGLGLLGRRLDALGAPYRRFQTWRQELDGLRASSFSGVVPLGGNMHASDEGVHPFLEKERQLLLEAVEEGVPVLGICLGAQLLALALGAEVRVGLSPEIGWLEVAPTAETAGDPLLGHLNEPATVFQWHMDELDLPEGAVRLASSAAFENQAFRHGNAWGVQFHPEVDFEQFDIWIGNHPGAAAYYGIDEDALRADVRRGSEAAESRSFREGLFDAFVELAERLNS